MQFRYEFFFIESIKDTHLKEKVKYILYEYISVGQFIRNDEPWNQKYNCRVSQAKILYWNLKTT